MRVNVRRRMRRLRGEDAWAKPASEFRVRTEDGVDLAVSRLGSAPRALVVAHAFLGYRTKPPWKRIIEALSERFTVYAPDLRGHGESGGACSGGPFEALDIRAVVARARADGHDWVGTVGGSLGGAAVIYEAATSRSSDLVCAVSPPGRWVRDVLHEPSGDDGLLRRRLLWVFGSASAQLGAAVMCGTRVSKTWAGTEAPLDVVDRIAPTPLIIVHGDNDHLFPASGAVEMAARAGEPKQLVIRPGFGHCEDGFDPTFCGWLVELLDQAATGGLPVDPARALEAAG